MSDMKKRFELTIDHPMLKGAKNSFDTCLKLAMARAIGTGSMEGSATVKVSFEIGRALDQKTGETMMVPTLKYKAGYSVPMKESFDNEICESSQLIRGPEDEILLVNDQICIDELLKGADE